MRKLWVLALKEVLLTFRDTSALFMMLATPLALTLVMMAAFGSGDSSPISDIPVLILNQDGAVEVHSKAGTNTVIELYWQSDTPICQPGDTVTLVASVVNAKAGHKVPSGSAEERQVWVTVHAVDAEGHRWHLPVDRKGFVFNPVSWSWSLSDRDLSVNYVTASTKPA